MAEALLQVVLDNLSSLIKDEIGLVMGVDQEMKKLLSTFTTIQAVLEDAEMKKLKDKAIENWLWKLKDLAYEIDDTLDECATHVSKLKLKNTKLSPKKLLFRFKIARRIRSIAEKLDAVAAERARFHLLEMAAVGRSREVDATRVTSSILNESHQVYGREEDQEKIIDMFVNGVIENQQISVLPIIGVGGLGKTTLAQSLYNDQRVVEHFEKRLWVCVSDNFDQETLVRALIESATTSGCASDLLLLDTLQQRLRELLNGRRYLLVLDDVWNIDQEKWSVLKTILACGSNGTSIIVTTRLKMVSDIMGTLPPHCLEGLSEEHCWMLMRDRAFAEDEKEKYPNLEAIGKQIVKKCVGVPMAAKALGGLLRFKRTEKEWIYVKESELWNLPEEETLILPALRLSYHHLPLELRQCFAYFAVFQKDHTIKKETLIHLWMSHGYITSRGILEEEDVGDQICNELLLRSLFQYDRFRTDHIMMHDLVHDLAQSIMQNKVPDVQVERQYTSPSHTKIRQVNLRNNLVAFPPSTRHDMDISSILTKFSHLRVLDASGRTTINDLPSNVGNLKHLRFLNLSYSDIRTLPSSLCNLWNLKILKLDYCYQLVALPKKMRYLKNLRHLHMKGCISLERMPTKIGELTSLKTLSMFIVGGDRGNQLEELECLKLGGRLEIKHLERVGSYLDAKKAKLCEKKELRELILEWESNDEGRGDKDEKVLEALQLPPNLQTLSIQGFGGRCFPVWMAEGGLRALPSLTDLRIINSDTLRCLPVEWLRHLRSLTVSNCPQLVELPEEIKELECLQTVLLNNIGEMECLPKALRQLSSLKYLYLWHLHRLNTLPQWLDELTSLEYLFIEDCPKLVSLPTCLKQMSNLQYLIIRDCSQELKRRCERGSGEEWHYISHIPEFSIK